MPGVYNYLVIIVWLMHLSRNEERLIGWVNSIAILATNLWETYKPIVDSIG